MTIRNVLLQCIDVCPGPIAEQPFLLGPGEQIEPFEIVPTGRPGRFLVLEGEDIDPVSMNLRVRNIAENAVDYGAEIPVVVGV